MKPFFIILLILAFGISACSPEPTAAPQIGTPLSTAAPLSTPLPVAKLPVISLLTPTSPPAPLAKITTIEPHGGRVSWLGSKNLLAFDETGSDGFDDVFTANLDGSNKVCLTCSKKSLPQKHNGNPDWDPNGDYLAFQSEDPGLKLKGQVLGEFMASPGVGINNNIWIMAADGSHFWQITHVAAMGGARDAHFSPDGRKLVWAEIIAGGGIGQWVIKLADFGIYKGQPAVSNLTTLSPLSQQWYQPSGMPPDQTRILFAGLAQGKGLFDSEIYTYNTLSKATVRLTENNEWDEYAQFSPDGQWIAWTSSSGINQTHSASQSNMETQAVKTDAWIMRADGSGKQRLTRFNDPAAVEGNHAPVGVTCGELTWGPSSRSFAMHIQVGHDQSIVLVEFDPASLAK